MVASMGRKRRAALSLAIAGLAVVGRPLGIRSEESGSDGQSAVISTGALVGMLLKAVSAKSDAVRDDAPLLPTAAPRAVPPGSLELILMARRGLIPISPYWDAETEAKWNGEVGTTPIAFLDNELDQDVPTPEQILKSIPKPSPADDLFVTESRQNVTIVTETLVNNLSEKRFYPQVGPARLRKRHFKCTVQYDRVRHHSWPVDYTTAESIRDVVYCDRDRLIPILADAP